MWQVVMGANIVGAGHGLEVGAKLELLKIRQTEALAEERNRTGANNGTMTRVSLFS